jgi:ATP-dependent DNA helicase RecG
VVGTHALFQDWLRFARLGLVMVDEQHRFGVQQRLALQEKGVDLTPHQLVLTATPIPRTLAMGLYADLDVSVIDALPPGRAGIRTVVLPVGRRAEVAGRVQAACRAGAQVYWVCPLIEESEQAQGEAAQRLYERLSADFPSLRLGLIHGRLAPPEREAVMTAFAQGDLDVLVATTVIEVGVDVPRATVMVVENAERFGLAQLHQLRGRVGRGTAPGNCVLLYEGPLSQTARARLETLRAVQDGFEIARRDLALRGAGEWLGTRQTGERRWRVADPVADADRLLTEDPALAERLIGLWQQRAERYAGA